MRYIIGFVLLVLPWASFADVVKWTDENGKVHYGDRVPEKYKDQSEQVSVDNPNFVKNDHLRTGPRKPVPPIPPKKQPPKSTENAGEEIALEEFCREGAQRYTDLTTVRIRRRGGVFGSEKVIEATLLSDEKGELTRVEQNRKAEKFRKELNAMGCNIPPTKKMKL